MMKLKEKDLMAYAIVGSAEILAKGVIEGGEFHELNKSSAIRLVAMIDELKRKMEAL